MLKDMAYTEKEARKVSTPVEAGDMPKYPYGLCLSLTYEIMEKLGMTVVPNVGTEVMVTAKAMVKSVSQHQEADGDNRSYVDLQITAMDVAMALDSGKAAKKLYGKDDD